MVLFDRPLIHNRFSWNLDRKLLKCKTLQRVGCFIEVEWMSIGKTGDQSGHNEDRRLTYDLKLGRLDRHSMFAHFNY